ncbi:hypothetical protein Tco_0977361 [Tanacetum coccineum]|uniref:Uncharacterized protein n=1 Tax=Tanacetum coccineum TaxID=301880 RepID=A0ABQ5EJZ1_9ASTR
MVSLGANFQAVVVILVKGHVFPTIVKVRPVGFDPLALVDDFTPVEDNIGLLETWFDDEAIFVFLRFAGSDVISVF